MLLPLECYRKADLAYDTNVFDCRFQWYAAEIVRLAYDDVDAARTFALAYFGQSSEAFVIPAGGTFHPQGILVKRFGEAFVFMTGTQTPTQWMSHGLTGLGDVTDYGAYFTGDWSELATRRALEVASALFGATPPTRWLWCGHSWGGQISFIAAAKILLGPSGARVDLLTMGMNKPGDSRLIDLVAGQRQCHLVNRFDPVPHIPPSRVPRWVSDNMIRPMLGEWERFRHPRVLTWIREGEQPIRLTDDMVDDATANGIGMILAQALVPEPGLDHKIPEYVATIRSYCPHLIPPYPVGAEQSYFAPFAPETNWPTEFNLRIRFGEMSELNVPLLHVSTVGSRITWESAATTLTMIELVPGDVNSRISFNYARLIYDDGDSQMQLDVNIDAPFEPLTTYAAPWGSRNPFRWEIESDPNATLIGPSYDVTRPFTFEIRGPRVP